MNEAAKDLLTYSPKGEYAYTRNHEDGTWAVGCFMPGTAELRAIVAKGMDKTLAAALAIILNEVQEKR